MLIRRPPDLRPSEITPRSLFEARRRFLAQASAAALGGWLSPDFARAEALPTPVGKSPFGAGEKLTPRADITSYNNFYEFGTSKGDPSLYAYKLPVRPWTVSIEGLVKKPRRVDIDDILRLAPLEERIYRLRCVEGWSMVVPWVGYPLTRLLAQVEPLGSAKFVEFESFYEPTLMSRLYFSNLDFPYVEGLRLDEALHPLTLLTVGLYGEILPKQNGAPLRIVVPWKYGFKSAKSIVRIRFVEEQPLTSWNRAAPREYGFYSNVNPEVDHPRWSQAQERRLGEIRKRPTLMFNGYAEQVASLYAGMDLKRSF
jgi:methionine sulfoxide reductase catalytic subunit